VIPQGKQDIWDFSEVLPLRMGGRKANPAKARNDKKVFWIPAFTGMTQKETGLPISETGKVSNVPLNHLSLKSYPFNFTHE
jgi:hypothetical protein